MLLLFVTIFDLIFISPSIFSGFIYKLRLLCTYYTNQLNEYVFAIRPWQHNL
jgi:hypothetical protein